MVGVVGESEFAGAGEAEVVVDVVGAGVVAPDADVAVACADFGLAFAPGGAFAAGGAGHGKVADHPTALPLCVCDPAGMTPNQIQVVTKPGGLSGGVHAVNIVVCLLTCGLWIPGYFAFAVLAPRRRVDVLAPPGTDVRLVEAARAQALMYTPEERRSHNRRLLAVAVVALSPFLLCGLAWVVARLSD